MRIRMFLLGAALSTLAVECPANPKPRDAWKKILQECAQTDVLGKKVLYLGPSNNVGVGSIWLKRENGFGLRYRSSDLQIPRSLRYVNRGQPVRCSGETRSGFHLRGDAALGLLIASISGDAASYLSRGRSITVGVSSYRWDTLVEGVFETWFQQSADLSLRNDLLGLGTTRQDPRYIITKALWVSGFSAEIEFDSGIGAQVKASVSESAFEKAQAGTKVRFKWVRNEKLLIESKEAFVLAGELARFTPAGVRDVESVPVEQLRVKLRSEENLEDATAETPAHPNTSRER